MQHKNNNPELYAHANTIRVIRSITLQENIALMNRIWFSASNAWGTRGKASGDVRSYAGAAGTCQAQVRRRARRDGCAAVSRRAYDECWGFCFHNKSVDFAKGHKFTQIRMHVFQIWLGLHPSKNLHFMKHGFTGTKRNALFKSVVTSRRFVINTFIQCNPPRCLVVSSKVCV